MTVCGEFVVLSDKLFTGGYFWDYDSSFFSKKEVGS